eukprot:m.81682 g.81682  ORF g.81682 m.81682 type:complete len:357 (+) comp14881_c3_seq4:205-1275(+)
MCVLPTLMPRKAFVESESRRCNTHARAREPFLRQRMRSRPRTAARRATFSVGSSAVCLTRVGLLLLVLVVVMSAPASAGARPAKRRRSSEAANVELQQQQQQLEVGDAAAAAAAGAVSSTDAEQPSKRVHPQEEDAAPAAQPPSQMSQQQQQPQQPVKEAAAVAVPAAKPCLPPKPSALTKPTVVAAATTAAVGVQKPASSLSTTTATPTTASAATPTAAPAARPKSPKPRLVPGPIQVRDQLNGQPWFAGMLDRKVAEAKILMNPVAGHFMLRESTSERGEFTLSLHDGTTVRHVRIQTTDKGRYALRENADEKEQFAAIPDMMAYYSVHRLLLRSGATVCLTHCCKMDDGEGDC